MPKYPPALEDNDSYDYPHTGQMYGQSFLCISLHTKSSAEQIGTQMLYNHPYVYSINVPKWVSTTLLILMAFVSILGDPHCIQSIYLLGTSFPSNI